MPYQGLDLSTDSTQEFGSFYIRYGVEMQSISGGGIKAFHDQKLNAFISSKILITYCFP